jgi:hypothetical protein
MVVLISRVHDFVISAIYSLLLLLLCIIDSCMLPYHEARPTRSTQGPLLGCGPEFFLDRAWVARDETATELGVIRHVPLLGVTTLVWQDSCTYGTLTSAVSFVYEKHSDLGSSLVD